MDKGISVALPITEKCLHLLEDTKDDLFFDKRTVSEAVNGNGQLMKPYVRHKNIYLFLELYPKVGFQKAAKRVMASEIRRDSIMERIKRILSKNENIYNASSYLWHRIRK